jgi:hypothetical protein
VRHARRPVLNQKERTAPVPRSAPWFAAARHASNLSFSLSICLRDIQPESTLPEGNRRMHFRLPGALQRTSNVGSTGSHDSGRPPQRINGAFVKLGTAWLTEF